MVLKIVYWQGVYTLQYMSFQDIGIGIGKYTFGIFTYHTILKKGVSVWWIHAWGDFSCPHYFVSHMWHKWKAKLGQFQPDDHGL